MTKTLIITRHQGAVEWIQAVMGIENAQVVTHLDQETIDGLQKGDQVIGVLPVHLIAELNMKGVRTYALIMNVPPELRGKELTAQDMSKLGARVEEVLVMMGHDLEVARSGWEAILYDTGQPYLALHPLLEV